MTWMSVQFGAALDLESARGPGLQACRLTMRRPPEPLPTDLATGAAAVAVAAAADWVLEVEEEMDLMGARPRHRRLFSTEPVVAAIFLQ